MIRLASVVVVSSLLVSVAEGQVVPVWGDVHSDNVNMFDRTFVAGLEAHPQGGIVAVCTVSTLVSAYPTVFYDSVRSQIVRWAAGGQKLWVRDLGQPCILRAVDAQGVSYVVGGSGFKAVSPDGVITWTATAPANVSLQYLTISPSGQIIAAGNEGGEFDSNFYVSAWSNTGTFLWGTSIDAPHSVSNQASSMTCAANGDIVVAGREFWLIGSDWDSNVSVARLDAGGNVLWSRSIGSTPVRREDGHAVGITDGGDIVVAGQGRSMSGLDPDHYMVRLDTAGTLLWEMRWASPTPQGHQARQVNADADGSTWSFFNGHGGIHGSVDVFHHAADGALLGSAHHGPGSLNAFGGRYVRGTAGGFYLVTTTSGDPHQMPYLQDGLIMQIDRDATVNWQLPFESTNPQPFEAFYDIARVGDLLVVGGTSNTRNDPPGGVAQIRAFDVSTSPQGYCEGKVNSLGCTPQMEFSGMPSATATSGFVISATQALNRRRGMLIYSTAGAASVPFAGGLRCIAAPVHRTPVRMSGGSALPANDCSGAYEIDWNAYAHGQAGGNPDPALTTPGTTIWVQAWGRDPGFLPPQDVSLSNGMRFVVLP